MDYASKKNSRTLRAVNPSKDSMTKNPPIQFKRGSSKAFYKDNPVLLAGQPAVELDTHKLKIGDGFTRWRSLPYVSNGDAGKPGKSAYEIWRENGQSGSVDDFFSSLIGEPGKSAYEVWLSAGNKGSIADFLIAIQGTPGEDGDSAYILWIKEGNSGSVTDFLNSLKGDSAYDIWLSLGNEGTEEDFLASLKGDRGYSAYEIWTQEGNDGTVEDFLESLNGKSAYDLYVEGGGTMSEEEYKQYLISLIQWGTF